LEGVGDFMHYKEDLVNQVKNIAKRGEKTHGKNVFFPAGPPPPPPPPGFGDYRAQPFCLSIFLKLQVIYNQFLSRKSKPVLLSIIKWQQYKFHTDLFAKQ
jgi:hypothetical protein